MRIRHLVSEAKTLLSDTNWSTKDMPPRHAPIYAKTRPIRSGWRWRSARARAGTVNFILTALCNPGRDNWQAILMIELDQGASVIARFEHHGSHPGLHVHAHCEKGGVVMGGASMDGLVRAPSVGEHHRRTNAWTETTFWEAAKRFFRVMDDDLPLFSHGT